MNRIFRLEQEDKYSKLKEINSGVPHGNILRPILYILCTNGILRLNNVKIATFVDDTALVAVDQNQHMSTIKLQTTRNIVLD